ncbi:MAG: peroxiredoxin-like family protein [Pseudomonadota bacterium]
MTIASLVRPLLAALVLALSVPAHAVVAESAEGVSPVLVGSQAPAFTLRTSEGEAYEFNPEQLERPVLLAFYRGGWCPYCNAQLMGMRAIEDDLQALGYDLLFASADSVKTLAAAVAEMAIEGEDDAPAPGYALLSDASMEVAEAFGVAFRMADEDVEKYKGYGIDLEAASGYDHHTLPVPAVFLIDAEGVIRFSYVNPNFRYRVDPRLLLTAAEVVLTQKPLAPLRNSR